jgi:hypothetical protein
VQVSCGAVQGLVAAAPPERCWAVRLTSQAPKGQHGGKECSARPECSELTREEATTAESAAEIEHSISADFATSHSWDVAKVDRRNLRA